MTTDRQGGAADVVMMAMLNIQRSQKLRELGWTLLLQVFTYLRDDMSMVVWLFGCSFESTSWVREQKDDD